MLTWALHRSWRHATTFTKQHSLPAGAAPTVKEHDWLLAWPWNFQTSRRFMKSHSTCLTCLLCKAFLKGGKLKADVSLWISVTLGYRSRALDPWWVSASSVHTGISENVHELTFKSIHCTSLMKFAYVVELCEMKALWVFQGMHCWRHHPLGAAWTWERKGAPAGGGLQVEDPPIKSHTSMSHRAPGKAGQHTYAPEAIRQVIHADHVDMVFIHHEPKQECIGFCRFQAIRLHPGTGSPSSQRATQTRVWVSWHWLYV